MKKMKLGKSNLEIPRLGVGCMRMESLTADEAERFVLEAVEQVCDFAVPRKTLPRGGHHHIPAAGVGAENPGHMAESLPIRQRGAAKFCYDHAFQLPHSVFHPSYPKLPVFSSMKVTIQTCPLGSPTGGGQGVLHEMIAYSKGIAMTES